MGMVHALSCSSGDSVDLRRNESPMKIRYTKEGEHGFERLPNVAIFIWYYIAEYEGNLI